MGRFYMSDACSSSPDGDQCFAPVVQRRCSVLIPTVRGRVRILGGRVSAAKVKMAGLLDVGY